MSYIVSKENEIDNCSSCSMSTSGLPVDCVVGNPYGCKIKQLPKVHGRLIDEDEFIKHLKEDYPGDQQAYDGIVALFRKCTTWLGAEY